MAKKLQPFSKEDYPLWKENEQFFKIFFGRFGKDAELTKDNVNFVLKKMGNDEI